MTNEQEVFVDRARPIFIGGAPRSGSTLLADLLGLHSSLSPVYDTPFLVDVCLALFVRRSAEERAAEVLRIMTNWSEQLERAPRQAGNGSQYHHGTRYVLFNKAYVMERTTQLLDDLNAGDALVAFQSFVGDLFAKHSRLDGKPIWVNKLSHYVEYAPLLKAVFPNMLFVHVVRDGRDAAVDMIAEEIVPNDFLGAMERWRRAVREGVVFGRACPESYVQIRFEDLIANPEVALGRVLDRMGEAGASEIVQRHHTGQGVFDASRCGIWEDVMSPETASLVAEQFGGALDALGYDRSLAVPVNA